jgi:hypothetical protein
VTRKTCGSGAEREQGVLACRGASQAERADRQLADAQLTGVCLSQDKTADREAPNCDDGEGNAAQRESSCCESAQDCR